MLVSIKDRIPAMSETAINNVRKLEELVLKAPQTKIATDHLFHAGLYARTITIPAETVLTGALIEIATVLIVQGRCIVYIGDESKELHGYHILAASAGRKQAFIAIDDTHLTMLFATDARTVEEAEDWFTDEAHLLFSRTPDAINNVIVGE